MQRISLIIIAALLSVGSYAGGKNLKGAKLNFVCQDTVFKHPFIDVDKTIEKPARCRYIHGGFSDGTRFSLYMPLEKKDFTGRFFQYITPFPDSETAALNHPEAENPVGFSISHGAYFVETNEGGKLDFSDESTRREATIGAFRANAACAELSRYIAQLIYGCERPYGYCYGGSGGAYRTVGGIEHTEGVWDGAVPFVLGSDNAIPNVFSARMYGLRVLRDKLDDIADALMPGGSGDPYRTLTAEQRQVLQEVTRMGFPIKSWSGWRFMDVHGFVTLYQALVQMDRDYFRKDFWQKPGYLGYDNPASLARDRVQVKAIVRRIIGQQEAEQLGLVQAKSEAERGTADRAWASMGSDIPGKPVAYEIDHSLEMHTLGGDLIILKNGERLQVSRVEGNYVVLADVNAPQRLTYLHAGDSVQVDNSDFLAVETYHRHQVPTPDYHGWNQFRGINNQPIYPQRPFLVGPLITLGAAGCQFDGNIKCKVILCCSVWDREAFAWQGDWYRKKVRSHLGDKIDNHFRLWYTDRATHSDGVLEDPRETVSYVSTLYQAMLDLSDWVERGIAPSSTTDYRIEEGQVVMSANGASRGGIQPAVTASIAGQQRVEVAPGTPVSIHVVAECPVHTGRIVKAEWCIEGTTFSEPVDLAQAQFSADGSRVEFDTTVTYTTAGTYFPTVRVYSERNGDAETTYTRIANLGKVRVVVK